MKAVVISRFGDPDGLEVVDLPASVPAPGQVRITTEAIGVGGVDAVIRRGTLAAYGFQPGHLPGSEVAGRVTSLGEGVDASWMGRRVWAFTGLSGGYAEQAVASVEDVLPLPDGLSGANAVTLGGSGAVAHFALDRARLAPRETVLVRGAAGSIGITAVQLAATGGAGAVAVTTSSAERGARLRDLGATHVLDRAGDGGRDAPSGFDVVIDVVGGTHLPLFLDRLNSNGRYIAVGVVGGQPPHGLRHALDGRLPPVAVVLHVQLRHRARLRTPGRAIVPVRRCRARRPAHGRARRPAAGPGRAGPPGHGQPARCSAGLS